MSTTQYNRRCNLSVKSQLLVIGLAQSILKVFRNCAEGSMAGLFCLDVYPQSRVTW